MKAIYFSIFLFFSGLFSPLVWAQTSLNCKVVGISDGDTLTCLVNKTPLKVRLLYIDAPESAQPYGNKAKQTLANLAFKKQVTIETQGLDRYGRTLAVVFDEKNQNINLTLVQMGMAWAYSETLPIYQQAMENAKQQKLGLWQDKYPINPALWRKQHSHFQKRSDSSQNLQNSIENSPLIQVNCKQKRTCGNIKDFAMAQRYFQQCGWKELDGNNDGIPCNKLYREAMKHRE